MAWTNHPLDASLQSGLTVSSNIEYVLVQTTIPYTHEPQNVILARVLLPKYFKEEGEVKGGSLPEFKGKKGGILPHKIIASFKGAELEGIEYEQLMPYQANSPAKIEEITPAPNRSECWWAISLPKTVPALYVRPLLAPDDLVGQNTISASWRWWIKKVEFIGRDGVVQQPFCKKPQNDEDYVDVNVDISVDLKKEEKAQSRKIRTQLSALLAYRQTDSFDYPLDAWFIKPRHPRENGGTEQYPSTGNQRVPGEKVAWQLAREYGGLEPEPKPLLGCSCRFGVPRIVLNINHRLHRGNWIPKSERQMKYWVAILTIITCMMVFWPAQALCGRCDIVGDDGPPDAPRSLILIDVWFDSAMPYAQWGLNHEKLEASDPMPFNQPFESDFPADFISRRRWPNPAAGSTPTPVASLVFDSWHLRRWCSNGLVLDKTAIKWAKTQ